MIIELSSSPADAVELSWTERIYYFCYRQSASMIKLWYILDSIDNSKLQPVLTIIMLKNWVNQFTQNDSSVRGLFISRFGEFRLIKAAIIFLKLSVPVYFSFMALTKRKNDQVSFTIWRHLRLEFVRALEVNANLVAVLKVVFNK